MQRMQRKVGAFLPRTADDHQVGMLIADFHAADKMLETLIEASKTWRDSWTSILNHQSAMLADYENVYGNITGKDGKVYEETPQEKLDMVHGLKTSYVELKNEMAEEIACIDKQIMAPAKEARTSVKAYMKVIKKRQDKKLDYERYKSRVESLQAKARRSERENTALSKHQIDYAAATAAYEAADDHLKQTLPSMTHSTYSLLPHLLNSQIMIQNALLAQLYTVLQGFCSDFGVPSDPPEAHEIIRDFEADFNKLRIELESGIMTIARGKAVKEPMGGSDKAKSYTGLGLRGRMPSGRTPSSTTSPIGRPALPPAYGEEKQASPAASQDAPQLNLETRPRIPSSTPSYTKSPGGYLSANPYATYGSPSPSAMNGHQNDYFGSAASTNGDSLHRIPSATPSISSTTSLSTTASGKKAPPPPPPPKKRLGSFQIEYVTAKYDFVGQAAGDLSFREGEKIRIVKKTGSTDDWWEGELRGMRGSFPANYCA